MDLEKMINRSGEMRKTFLYETDFVKGLELEISYIAPDELDRIREQHRPARSDRREDFNFKNYVAAFTDRALRGWKGLTIRNLKGLIPLTPDMLQRPEGEEVQCSQSNARVLVRNTYGLWMFMFERATEVGYFQPADFDAEKKT